MFRYKKSVPMGYEQQGYIYFKSRCYRDLPRKEQKQITALCAQAGGEYQKAVFEFVTGDEGATAVCLRHNLSRSTLERAVRRYYLLWAEEWEKLE